MGIFSSSATVALSAAALLACGSSAPPFEPVTEILEAPPAAAPAAPPDEAPPPASPPSLAAPSPPSPGCGPASASAKAGMTKRSIVVGGKTRTYHLSVPKGYDPARPHTVAVILHGATDTTPQEMQDWFPVEANLSRALVAYPQALTRTHADGSGGNVTRWDLDGSTDLDFFDAILADVGKSHCVDPAHVVAAGFSSGGNFAHQLACLRRANVKAFAAVAGPGPFVPKCNGAVAAWMTHDVDDDALPVSGARKARDFWAATNGCSGPFLPTATPGCTRVSSCAKGAPIVYCETTGVGHDVPSFAASAIGKFFQESL